MSDDVTQPDMLSAALTLLGPALEQTGEHRLLPDGYCPDCQGDCVRGWWPRAVIDKLPQEEPRTLAEQVADIAALRAKATPGEWTSTTEGSHDQKGAAAKAFLAVMATSAPDNPDIQFSDMSWVRSGWPNVAMTGNGPKAPENAAFIAAVANLDWEALAAAARTAGSPAALPDMEVTE